jgi:hypothetical protein
MLRTPAGVIRYLRQKKKPCADFSVTGLVCLTMTCWDYLVMSACNVAMENYRRCGPMKQAGGNSPPHSRTSARGRFAPRR